ncbi:MAG: hypothetical protein Q8M98_10020 [Candidatus Cloacimonadaceae bacterium]|nr:hypothetical protein [Candidatus Cloacimonadaceae bacterium]
MGSDTHPVQSSYRISQPSNQSMQFSVSKTGYTHREEIKPPYWYAILAIVAGIVTVTIVPSIIGIFSLIKCSEASKANSRGDYEEAKKLAHQAVWNPFGMPPTLIWIISILAVIGIVILIVTLTSY